jgi:nicotinate-nucleotide adenylyltransferase
MRVAVYGGSFNPPHVGHAMVASWLLWTDQVDEVWLVPVGAHAFGKALVPFERRLHWCAALAATLGPAVRVSDVERDLPAPSYTLRTLEALAERHPSAALRLVLGSDNLPQLDRWHRWDAIAARFDPLVVARAGSPEVDGTPTFPGVSSTDVRARLVRGAATSGLVPSAVIAEITAADIELWRRAG